MNELLLRAEVLRLRWQLLVKEIEIRQLRDVLSAVARPPTLNDLPELPPVEPLKIEHTTIRRVRSPLVAAIKTIKVGEGFTSESGALRTSIHNLARRSGIKVETTKISEGKYQVVRIK